MENDESLPAVKVIAEETGIVDSELFVRSDGVPMAFMMPPMGLERQQIKQFIETGGGVLVHKTYSLYKENIIRLADPEQRTILIVRDRDIFDYNYIFDCMKHKSLVPNLNDYIVGKSAFEPYNSLDILCGNRKWSDLKRVEVGERVSDIEDGEEDEPVRRPVNMFKPNRLPYSRKEQEQIVNWIIENHCYKDLRGINIWKTMEKEVVMRGRSYQSLKEHFRKQIIPQIHKFKLSEDIVDNFKVGMGLKEDDLVGARISVMKKNSPTKPSKANQDVSVPETVSDSPKKGKDHASFGPESSQDDDTDSHSDKLVIDRPSQTVVQKPNHESPLNKTKPKATTRNDIIDTLLNNSSIDEPEPENEESSSTSTELLLEDNQTLHQHPPLPDRKKLRQFRLHSDRPLDSPCDPNTPFTMNRRKKKPAGQIDLPPASTQAFSRELREARGSADTFDDEDVGLTSTQNMSGDDDEEKEVFVNKASPLLDMVDECTLKLKGINKLSPEKEKTVLSAKNVKPCRVDVARDGLTHEALDKGYVTLNKKEASLSLSIHTTPPGSPSLPKPSSASTPRNRRVTPDDAPQPGPSKHVEDLPESQNLLERYLADHEKYSQDGDMVDSLNNVAGDNKENEDDDEVSFRSPSSLGGRNKRDNEGFLSPSPVKRKRVNNDPDRWETSTIKSGRFYNEGIFGASFRLAFSANEEKAIVKFFLEKGGFHLRKGNKIWKSMEAHNICPHRTWQSIKARWDKYLSKSLAKYKVTNDDLVAADRRIYGDGDPSITSDSTDRRSEVSAQSGGQRRPYTKEEDITIIRHLLQNRRHEEVKGKNVWESMENSSIVPGRSWQSLKERYLKVIRKNLVEKPNKYGVKSQIADKLVSQ